jgi:arylsulfatase
LLLLSCGGRGDGVNVIVIVIDTLRADALGCYGAVDGSTPNLDAMGARGVLFRTCVSQAPWTLPAMAALISGRYPSALGFDRVRNPLPRDAPHLAEVLRDEGYATGGVVSNFYLRGDFGFDRGFRHYDIDAIGGAEQSSSDAVIDSGIRWLEETGDPFFLFLHFMDPHYEYLNRELFAPGVSYDGELESGMSIHDLRARGDELRPADIAFLRRLYASEVRYLDHSLRKLRRYLHESGRAHDTVILVTSDHGEEFLEHGWLGHTRDMYQEVLRVPLIVAGPGASPEIRQDAASLIDIFPTVASVAGAVTSEGPGRDLLGRDRSPRGLYSEVEYVRRKWHGPAQEQNAEGQRIREAERRKFSRQRSLVLGRWKTIEDRETGTWQLFDLATDPGETRDLLGVEPETAKRMQAAISEFDSVETFERGDAVRVLEKDVDRLRALGYAQ